MKAVVCTAYGGPEVLHLKEVEKPAPKQVPDAYPSLEVWIGAVFCIIVAWFAILFTGKCPRAPFDYVVGAERWSLRVSAYSVLLITDQHPSFSLSE